MDENIAVVVRKHTDEEFQKLAARFCQKMMKDYGEALSIKLNGSSISELVAHLESTRIQQESSPLMYEKQLHCTVERPPLKKTNSSVEQIVPDSNTGLATALMEGNGVRENRPERTVLDNPGVSSSEKTGGNENNGLTLVKSLDGDGPAVGSVTESIDESADNVHDVTIVNRNISALNSEAEGEVGNNIVPLEETATVSENSSVNDDSGFNGDTLVSRILPTSNKWYLADTPEYRSFDMGASIVTCDIKSYRLALMELFAISNEWNSGYLL